MAAPKQAPAITKAGSPQAQMSMKLAAQEQCAVSEPFSRLKDATGGAAGGITLKNLWSQRMDL
jgi:hypothetical protein